MKSIICDPLAQMYFPKCGFRDLISLSNIKTGLADRKFLRVFTDYLENVIPLLKVLKAQEKLKVPAISKKPCQKIPFSCYS